VPRIVLCRHAATDHNLAMRYLSTSDLPLGAHGRAQCETLRGAIGSLVFERCLVSPMRRCLETREIVAASIPFAIEPALREVDFGSWEGRTPEWVERNDPEGLARRRSDPVNFEPPGGESIARAALRIEPLAQRLRDEPQPTLVIGHRISLGILERLLRGLPLDARITGLEPAEFRAVRE